MKCGSDCRMILSASILENDGHSAGLTREFGGLLRQVDNFANASELLNEYSIHGKMMDEFIGDLGVNVHIFNKHFKLRHMVYIIYNTKVVVYEITAIRGKYSKHIVDTIQIGAFPEPYLYIGIQLNSNHRWAEKLSDVKYHHGKTAQDVIRWFRSIRQYHNSKLYIYKVPLDHLGGPDYVFMACNDDMDHELYFDNPNLPTDPMERYKYDLRLMSFERTRVNSISFDVLSTVWMQGEEARCKSMNDYLDPDVYTRYVLSHPYTPIAGKHSP